MRASEIVEEYPVVRMDDDALAAAWLLARRRLPGLVVTDEQGRPQAVVPPSQVLRFVIPKYVQEDLALARVFDEQHADHMCDRLRGTRVRDVLPPRPDEIPVVDEDATVVEIAAVMARMRSPVVAVVRGEEILGAVTVAGLLHVLLPKE